MTRNGGKRAHQGIDLIASPGTAVYAVADGTVHLGIAPNASYAYGNTLILVVKVDDLPEPQASVFRKINPDNKTIGFFYAHLGEFCVKGGPVSAGQLIAKSGSSGNAANMTTIATGAHLHFEVRKKALVKAPGLTNRVDPLLFLPKVANK
jgi:murein DD-endopeptidase MepM/ murein hydrolase activator NlpD